MDHQVWSLISTLVIDSLLLLVVWVLVNRCSSSPNRDSDDLNNNNNNNNNNNQSERVSLLRENDSDLETERNTLRRAENPGESKYSNEEEGHVPGDPKQEEKKVLVK